MKCISDIYKDCTKAIPPDDLNGLPAKIAGAMLAEKMFGRITPDFSAILNITTSFVIWWRSGSRRIWQPQEETSEFLRTVGLSFVPEVPPDSWSGDCLVLESPLGHPFLNDIFSAVCYRIRAGEKEDGKYRYFFAFLDTAGGAYVFSIDADIHKINNRMVKDDSLFTDAYLPWGNYPTAGRAELFSLIKFMFSFGFFVDFRHFELHEIPGLPKRNARGKVERKKGRPVSMWNYADVGLRPRPEGVSSVGEAAPRDHLELSPVVVSPHLRMLRSGEVKFIEAHDSSRWKNPAKIGNKVKI